MAQYIDKDTLVAEIERREEINKYRDTNDSLFEDEAILYFIDTLEVKEADLEKIIKEEYLKWRCYGGKDNMLVILSKSNFNRIAKHFFELGLKAQKEE